MVLDQSKVNEWDGAERREIPIHIINYVRDSISTAFDKVTAALLKQNEESEKRHSLLVDKITTYQLHVELMENAFLKNDNGLPDYEGHRKEHFLYKAKEEWWSKVKQNTFIKVLEWGSVGTAAWIFTKIMEGKV